MKNVNEEWTEKEIESLKHAYHARGVAVDQLPYTADFKKLCAEYNGSNKKRGPGAIWTQLLKMRKRGALGRKGVAHV
jgi:serine/threonine-protein kinase RIO1